MTWLSQQFELSRHGDAHNLRPMEGLRGFAVFLVFLTHYCSLTAPWTRPLPALAAFMETIHTIGNAGVDLFFVLSGYLIYGTLIARPQRWLPFMRRRVARIYPAFCVVFAVYLLLSLLMPGESRIPAGSWPAVAYVLQNFLLLPGLFDITPIITVAWSLSYEMFYYLVLPLVVVAFGLRARSAAVRVAFFTAAAALMAWYCAVNTGPVRLIMFAAGILLKEAMAVRTPRVLPPRGGYALALLAAGLAATTMPFAGPAAYTVKVLILCLSFFTVCYCCFCAPDGRLARAFCWTPLRWLGNMSYSYYLLHGLALKILFKLVAAIVPTGAHEIGFAVAMLPVAFAVTLLPTVALFLLVERPYSLAVGAQPRPAVRPAGYRA